MLFTLLGCSLQRHRVVLELHLKLFSWKKYSCCIVPSAALCLLLYSPSQMPLNQLTHGCWFPAAGAHFEVELEDTTK